MYFFVLKVEKALFVLVSNSQLLSIQAACRGWTSALRGKWKEKKKRASWREPVFFQSDSVAVKFRAWIFNQNGFPVKDLFSRLLSLHNKQRPPRHCTIFTVTPSFAGR